MHIIYISLLAHTSIYSVVTCDRGRIHAIVCVLLLLILYNTLNVLRVNQQPVLAAQKS